MQLGSAIGRPRGFTGLTVSVFGKLEERERSRMQLQMRLQQRDVLCECMLSNLNIQTDSLLHEDFRPWCRHWHYAAPPALPLEAAPQCRRIRPMTHATRF